MAAPKHQDTYVLQIEKRRKKKKKKRRKKEEGVNRVNFALRPQKRDGILGTGTVGGGTKE